MKLVRRKVEIGSEQHAQNRFWNDNVAKLQASLTPAAKKGLMNWSGSFILRFSPRLNIANMLYEGIKPVVALMRAMERTQTQGVMYREDKETKASNRNA